MEKVILFALLLAVSEVLTISTFLNNDDQQRLQEMFKGVYPLPDIQSAHFSIFGLKLLGVPQLPSKETCTYVQTHVDSGDVGSVYHASAVAKMLSGCKLNIPGAKRALTDAISSNLDTQNITNAFFALKNLGYSVDEAAVNASLIRALASDPSPINHGLSFLAAAQMKGDTSVFFDKIDTVMGQADEVGDRYIQFEGGLYETATVIHGIYQLALKENKMPAISQDRVAKVSVYLMSRRHVRGTKASCMMLAALKSLTDNKYHVPVVVSVAHSLTVSQSQPIVKVKVTNLLGGDLGQLTVTADSARHLGSDAIILNKKQFTAVAGDRSLYELNLMTSKPLRGFYHLTVSAVPKIPDSRLIGLTGAEVEVKLTSTVTAENMEISVVDTEHGGNALPVKLVYPGKAPRKMDCDFHQKIVVKFILKDQLYGELTVTHQAFVRLVSLDSKQEIIFVAEADRTLGYLFELDARQRAAEFGHRSGKYSLELIVGDAVIEKSFSWILVDVHLTFPESGVPAAGSSLPYATKPEIKHLFREPEKRPPGYVSMIFTGLAVLPMLILMVLWVILGINVARLTSTVSAVGFHVCLAAIFLLYYFYWTRLNMFQTLRYLALLGVPTFLFGNRLLSGIAANRKLG